jgi:hypothetical protein
MSNITKLIEENYSTIHDVWDGAFGQWINGLWGWFPELSLDEQKEAFLILLKRLLDEGKIVLFVPTVMQQSDEINAERSYREWDHIWNISNEQMIAHIRNTWPCNITDEHDSELNLYWYMGVCPEIGWIHPETGELVAS